MSRTQKQLYPDFSAYIDFIDENGVSPEIIYKIINKHRGNSKYNENLYKRYQTLEGAVPISRREPRFEEEKKPINNKIINDFFGEIVDFKTGYFAGKAIAYGYSNTDEAEETTGGENAVDEATKALTDFTTRNNMYGVDLETTKLASIYGYAGRLFYIDEEGNERVMPVHGYETIVLSKTNISEPKYAIRYYKTYDVNDVQKWTVEFYDNTNIYTYSGMLSQLKEESVKPHMFDYCPLQGIANNNELLGDAEKVLPLIDDYDKVLSDNSNEVEAFVHAYLIFEGLNIDEKTIAQGQKNGSFVFPAMGTQQGKAYFLTKNINDSFTEHHLQRVEDNIYRFSKTPNLEDTTFGTASGEALKFKLHGLETKCGMFEAMMMNAGQHMFKVLASAWGKKRIPFDPLQATMSFTRNFPLNSLSNAQTAQALIAAGVPEEIAWDIAIPEIDDIDYVKELKEQEQEDVAGFYEDEEGSDELEEDTEIEDELDALEKELDIEEEPDNEKEKKKKER